MHKCTLTSFLMKSMALHEGLMTPCSPYLPVRFASLMCASYRGLRGGGGLWQRRGRSHRDESLL